jgi:hypothetical protein
MKILKSHFSYRAIKRPSRFGSNPQTSGQRDEQGMLMLGLAVALMVVLSLVTVTVVSGAVGQIQLSSTTTNKNSAIEGALAGVQAMVGSIRAAASSGSVVTSELPCSNITGATNTSGSSSYVVSVQYQDETSSGSYTSVGCTTGSGPTVPANGDYLARAVITSCSPSTSCSSGPNSSPSGASWRRVVSTYDFETSYSNIPGGLIDSYSGKECFVAVYNSGNTPSGGVTLEVTNSCSASNPLEQFEYTTNWNLAIVLDGQEYCVQDPQDGSPATTSPVAITDTSGSCTASAAAQWGVSNSGNLEGVSVSSTGDPNGYCLDNPLSSDPTATMTIDATVSTCDESFDNTSTWYLSPEVGAGASQPASGQVFGVTDQLVNFEEFGDCLDVTNLSVTSNFLIDYMCKQFPDTTNYPDWNQRWCFQQLGTNSSSLPVGLLYTPDGQTGCSSPSSPYCLQSPLATATSNSTAYVVVTSCNISTAESSQPTNLLWTEWGTSGGLTNEYTWTDNDGYCLEANTANKQNPSGNGDTFSTIQVDTCNGSYEQKWNAPAILGTSQIVNTHEGTGSGSVSGP